MTEMRWQEEGWKSARMTKLLKIQIKKLKMWMSEKGVRNTLYEKREGEREWWASSLKFRDSPLLKCCRHDVKKIR